MFRVLHFSVSLSVVKKDIMLTDAPKDIWPFLVDSEPTDTPTRPCLVSFYKRGTEFCPGTTLGLLSYSLNASTQRDSWLRTTAR